MKIGILFFVLGAALCISGCAARYVDVRGEKYEMISEREEKELILRARTMMKTISKKLPAADVKAIETQEPEIKFIYSGDRFGRAIVRWKFPAYEAGIEFEGQFLTEHMQSTVYSRKKHPDRLDYRRPPSGPKAPAVKTIKKRSFSDKRGRKY